MKTSLRERGVWVVASDHDRKVEGWLVGSIPQGLLVARDESLRDLMLVRESNLIRYDHERTLPALRYENAVAISDELRETNEAVSGPMRRAIDNLKFDRLHEFGHRASELKEQIRNWDRLYQDPSIVHPDRSGLVGYLGAQADQSTALHRSVYETIEHSGLADVVAEFGPRLAALPPETTIPAYDLEFEKHEELTETVVKSREAAWSQERHRESVAAAEATRERLLYERETQREKPTDDSTPYSRWVGPSLRILAGTGLAAANAAVAVTAGLTGTVTTLGATAVPTYVGVITSIYTGLAQVADGLEKIGRRK